MLGYTHMHNINAGCDDVVTAASAATLLRHAAYAFFATLMTCYAMLMLSLPLMPVLLEMPDDAAAAIAKMYTNNSDTTKNKKQDHVLANHTVSCHGAFISSQRFLC